MWILELYLKMWDPYHRLKVPHNGLGVYDKYDK